MEMLWIALPLLLIVAQINCGRYEKPSSYHNQMRNSYDDDFFWPKYFNKRGYEDDDFYPRKFSKSWTSFDEPSSYESSSNDIFSNEFRLGDYSKRYLDELSISDNKVKSPVFSYDENNEFGPSNWWKINKNCSGLRQSPVKIYESLTFPHSKANPLVIKGFAALPESIKAINSGHSFTVRPKYKVPIEIIGGPLGDSFILDNIHWHWGDQWNTGSEHALEGKFYAAEVHLVCYNSKFASLLEASTQPGGLAVLAFIFKQDASVEDNQSYFKLLSKVLEPEAESDSSTDIFCIKDLIKTMDFHYFNYMGSLTTPNCYETVNWIVSKNILRINPNDLEHLRQMKDGNGKKLRRNARPLQRLHRRKIVSY